MNKGMMPLCNDPSRFAARDLCYVDELGFYLLNAVCPNSEFTGMLWPLMTWCPENALNGPVK
jgi:hypothetical protein